MNNVRYYSFEENICIYDEGSDRGEWQIFMMRGLVICIRKQILLQLKSEDISSIKRAIWKQIFVVLKDCSE